MRTNSVPQARPSALPPTEGIGTGAGRTDAAVAVAPVKPLPKPHRFDFRTLKRATILITEPGFGQMIDQEDKDCESPRLREAVRAARKAYSAVMAKEHHP